MKTFELSEKKAKNGRRKFKAILYEIFPDSCIDDEQQVGTMYNENGITWIREYCEKALPSIQGMSLRCEFLDDDRTELCGHGETEINVEDGLPIFEDAVMVGRFDKGYIEDVKMPDGSVKTYCIGEGTIDGLCYHNFCEKLEEDINNGNAPFGSVEILKTDGNQSIIYKYGYKEHGRIPMVFEHSGYALLGVRPADQSAKILELNNKEGSVEMTEAEMKALVTQVVDEMSTHQSEINRCKEECEKTVAEANDNVAKVIAEKEEAIASSERIQSELDACKRELEEKCKEFDEKCQELEDLNEVVSALKDELAKAKAKERIGELNDAIKSFTDDEKAYAKDEIDAFNASPVESEVNSVVSKILEGIGKRVKDAEAAETVIAEQNAAKQNVDDIFAEVGFTPAKDEDSNIF